MNYEIPEQLAFYSELALRRPFERSPTEIGVAYDTFDPANATEVNAIISLALETNASVITTYAGGSTSLTRPPPKLTNLPTTNSHQEPIAPKYLPTWASLTSLS